MAGANDCWCDTCDPCEATTQWQRLLEVFPDPIPSRHGGRRMTDLCASPHPTTAGFGQRIMATLAGYSSSMLGAVVAGKQRSASAVRPQQFLRQLPGTNSTNALT
jgi:hypothetical protein